MTATPIPRTLLLTQWGEMDVSPPDRKAGRAAADPHDAALAGHAAGGGRRHRPASWTRARRSIGSARWWPRAKLVDMAAAEDPLRRAARAFRRPGRAGAWPAGCRRCATRRWPRLRRGRMQAAGGDDGGRGRRRCAGSDGHGDRARRTLRPGAVAPVARAGRARRRRRVSACCCYEEAGRDLAADGWLIAARHRGWFPDRRRGFPPARRRRCAGHAAVGAAGVPPGLPDPRSTRGCCTWPTATRRCCWRRIRRWPGRAARAARVLLRLFGREAAMETLRAG